MEELLQRLEPGIDIGDLGVALEILARNISGGGAQGNRGDLTGRVWEGKGMGEKRRGMEEKGKRRGWKTKQHTERGGKRINQSRKAACATHLEPGNHHSPGSRWHWKRTRRKSGKKKKKEEEKKTEEGRMKTKGKEENLLVVFAAATAAAAAAAAPLLGLGLATRRSAEFDRDRAPLVEGLPSL